MVSSKIAYSPEYIGSDSKSHPAYFEERLIELNDPASRLEESEDQVDHNFDKLVFVMGRILLWLMEPDVDLRSIGYRVYLLAYKVRPDLIRGMSLRRITALMSDGIKRGPSHQRAHDLATEIESIIELTSTRSHAIKSRGNHHAWAGDRGDRGNRRHNHLWVIKRFLFWRESFRNSPGARSPEARRVILSDLEPIRAFISELESTK